MKINSNQQNPNFGAKIPVKVCQVADKPSILATLSAAREAKSDNLILGLPMFVGRGYSSSAQASKNIGAIRYIRELSQNLLTPVQIAYVTNMKKAANVIRQVAKADKAKRPAGSSSYDIFQILANMTLPEIKKIKEAFPEKKILAKIPLPPDLSVQQGDELMSKTLKYAEDKDIDGILIDSAMPSQGVLVDWNIAKKLIDAVHSKTGKPVGLAGGLCPENVEDAVRQTSADLIDASTGFRVDRPGQIWVPTSGSTQKPPKDPFAVLAVLNAMKKYDTKYTL